MSGVGDEPDRRGRRGRESHGDLAVRHPYADGSTAEVEFDLAVDAIGSGWVEIAQYGTGRLSRVLCEHGLNEFQFSIFPARAVRGRRLFEDLDNGAPPLRLTGTRTLSSGVVILTYVVKASR